MFTSDSLKIYRKFFILAVMIAGLFIAISVDNKAKALPCCSTCFTDRNECIIACYHPIQQKWDECVEQNCDPVFAECTLNCDWGC